jgi:ADP-ribosylglycohydrolase
MPIPEDYLERVYAGVLGKIIGVYLGRPFEGWTYERIMAELGEINYYVHEQCGVPLIVTDDDISGTFTFLRALPDYGNSRDLTPAQIGQTWLNYLIEGRTILWWGGLGNSTEHTAYLRLKQGIRAPQSGAIATNGRVVAEQIGAQIFIDGWAMVAPGDPELAADLARRAASVSHDGEAIYGAQSLAAMEAHAFVERDVDALLDTALRLIPADSLIARVIHDVRSWHVQHDDWRRTREAIAATYGYDRYGGNCHMVPNHALIILGLLYGESNFQRSLMICNTSGWDTDCNSGNLGCLLGIKDGLATLDAGPDWRGPVADRLYLPTADGGRAITDAVTETYQVVNIGRALAGEQPIAPKEGARFHFELPGSVQGFQLEDSPASRGTAILQNVIGHSALGTRSLAIHCRQLAPGRASRVATPTFVPAATVDTGHYELVASPALYAGQTVTAGICADAGNDAAVTVRLYIQVYGPGDKLEPLYGPETTLAPAGRYVFTWQLPETGGAPIASVGLEVGAGSAAVQGTIYLDYLTWGGSPRVTFTRPVAGGSMWSKAWVNALDQTGPHPEWPESFRLMQNAGRGLLIIGTREWADYQVSATLTPHMVVACGLAARVQGLRRYYALLLHREGSVRLIKALDGETILAESLQAWEPGDPYTLRLAVEGERIRAWIEGKLLFDVVDSDRPLTCGGIALVCEEGRVATDAVSVAPI